jgi:hypothetical protein
MISKRTMRAAVAGAMALLFAGGLCAQQPPPVIPAAIAAMLKEHVGRWRATGEMRAGGRVFPLKGTRECTAVQSGAGVLCLWHDELSPDGRSHEHVEILGFDAETGRLRSARVSDLGILSTTTLVVSGNTMMDRSESGSEGSRTLAVNEITVTPGGGWRQRFTMDTSGQRVVEMNIQHERVAP